MVLLLVTRGLLGFEHMLLKAFSAVAIAYSSASAHLHLPHLLIQDLAGWVSCELFRGFQRLVRACPTLRFAAVQRMAPCTRQPAVQARA